MILDIRSNSICNFFISTSIEEKLFSFSVIELSISVVNLPNFSSTFVFKYLGSILLSSSITEPKLLFRVPSGELLPAALEMAGTIAGNAPVAVRQAKQAIRTGMDMGLAAGLSFEIEAYNRTVTTADRREGVAAFNEKRKPDFNGS